jgi:NADPH:quinone reductase-like Zn-dependent oxidoreductase
MAGEVDAVGEGVDELAAGDRVFGLLGGGSYAQYAVVHARALARLPAAIPFTEAAAIPEAFLTAWDAAVDQGCLASGDTFLVHAVGGGVGTAAVQIGLALGARVIGTSRTASKLQRASELGLRDGIVVADGGFASEVRRLTGDRGADVVLEAVGGRYVAEDLACAAPKARIVVIATTRGATVELDLATLMRKRALVRGTVLRSRPLEEKIAAAQTLERRIVPLFLRGLLRPVVDRVLPLERAADAHRLVQNNETFGKVVLEVS